MSHPFDADAVFGDEYLHFHAHELSERASDADALAIVALAPLTAGMSVLDAPCGHGRLAVRLADHGCAVTGVDRSTRFLELARRDAESRGVEVALHEGDLRALPVDGPYDVVVCWFTSFGYFDDEGNLAVLREFRRVLRDGGVLLVDTVHHDGYVRSFTEAPEAIVVDVDGDLMVDRNTFDVESGSIVCHRTTLRGAARADAHFSVRLPTVPEWRHLLAAAGFASVTVTDRDGGEVDLATWRHVVRAVA